MLSLASRIKLSARACARAFGKTESLFDGLLPLPDKKSKKKKKQSCHLKDTHTPIKKKRKRNLSRDHRVNLARLHASSTIVELERVSEIPSILHGPY